MDDKACRLEILRELKKTYDEDPHGILDKGGLLGLLDTEDMDKLKSLAENEWIHSIGTSVLADVIKTSVGE